MRFTAVFAVVFTAALLSLGSPTAHAAELPKSSSQFVDTVLLAQVNEGPLLQYEVAYEVSQKPVIEVEQVEEIKPAEPKQVFVTVKNGDSLTKIATAQKTTWVRIFDANKAISDPNVINPGQKLRIPEKAEKLTHRELPQATVAVATQASAKKSTATSRTTASAASYPVSANTAKAYIYARESGNNPNATNPNGCYGIGQDCNGVLRTMCGADYACQDAYFTRYATARYGSWEGALAFWQSHHWW